VSDLIMFEGGPEQLFDVRLERTEGSVRASMPLRDRYRDPVTGSSVGALGVLTDDVLAYQIIGDLPAGTWSISTEIWLDLLAPLPTDGSLVHGTSRTLAVDTFTGFSEGRLTDEHGHLLATCRERARAIAEDATDMSVPDFTLPEGEDVLELLDLQAVDDDTMTMPMAPHLQNPRGMLHGGVSLCASEVVAARSRHASNPGLVTTSVHIVHTRGIPDGAKVEFRATTRHAGRTLWVTDVTGWVDGKAGCVAEITAQPASPPDA